VDHLQQFMTEIRKHERLMAFPDTEAILSNGHRGNGIAARLTTIGPRPTGMTKRPAQTTVIEPVADSSHRGVRPSGPQGPAEEITSLTCAIEYADLRVAGNFSLTTTVHSKRTSQRGVVLRSMIDQIHTPSAIKDHTMAPAGLCVA
jgi:hypothetical protein